MGRKMKVSQWGKLFVLIAVLEFLAVLGMTIDNWIVWGGITGPKQREYIFSFLFIVCCLAIVYFAGNGVYQESVLELLICVFACFIVMAYVVYQFAYVDDPTNNRIILWVRLIIVVVFTVAVLPLAFLVNRSFGWRSFTQVGSDMRLTKLWGYYTVFTSLMKVDVLAIFICCYMGGLAVVYDVVDITIDVCMFAFTLIWALIGAYAARHEMRGLMGFYFFGFTVLPAYVGFKYGEYFHTQRIGHDKYGQAMLGTDMIALGAHLFLLVSSLIYYRKFGQGLKEALDSKKGETGYLVGKNGELYQAV